MSTTAAPRRGRAARPQPRGRPRARTRPRAAEQHRRPPARARTSGRAASLPSYLIVAVVGALLFVIVTLQIEALRANMAAGRIDGQIRSVGTDVQNLRAAYAARLPRSQVEQAAADAGMILPKPEAYQTLRVPKS